MGRCIGIDADMKKLAIMIKGGGGTCEEYECPCSEKGLQAFEEQLIPGDHIALEASLNSYYLYDRFKRKGVEVSLANPMKLKLLSKNPQKNDRNDAGKIAKLLYVDCLPTIWVPDEENRHDRELLHHRYALVRDRTRIKNRIRSILGKHGLVCNATDIQYKDAQVFLQKVLLRLHWTARGKLESFLRQLEMVEKEIEQAQRVIETRADRYPELDMLITIPGMDTLTAFTIITVIGDITRFPRPESLANYAGMVPRLRNSGKHSWSGSITKAGSKQLRWAVTEVVQSLVRQPGSFQKFYLKKSRGKRRGIALIACGRKLLEAIWHMLSHNEPFRETNPTLHSRKLHRREIRPRAQKTSPGDSLPALRENFALLRELAGGSSC